MLPRKHRVSTKELEIILREGRKVFGEHIGLTYLKNNESLKASVIISKKISKKAVDRNRQKRIIREIIRKVFSKKDFERHQYSHLFFIKKNILEIPHNLLLQEISELTKKLK